VLAAGGLVLAGGTLIAPPIAWAQPAERIRRIGWLSGTENVLPTLIEALRELGWVEGRNIGFDSRNAERQRERYAPMANDLVATKVEFIVAVAPGAIRAAMQASNEVPIVMAWLGRPRSGRNRRHRQPCAPRQQRHRRGHAAVGTRREAAGRAAPGRAQGEQVRRAHPWTAGLRSADAGIA
jgi:hypothetical protein